MRHSFQRFLQRVLHRSLQGFLHHFSGYCSHRFSPSYLPHHVQHPVPGLCLLIALFCAAGALHGAEEKAPVYPAPPGHGAPLAWLDASDGLGRRELRRSEVQISLGQPDEVKKWPTNRHTGKGGHSEMRYPALGLTFQINAEDANDRDPRLGWMTVALPWDGRTAQGLYLGMTEDAAMPIIRAGYKVKGSIAVSWGQGGYTKGNTVLAQNHGWRKTQSITFTFREKRLYRIEAQLKPTPLVSLKDIRALLRTIVSIALVALLGLGFQAVRERLGSNWERLRTLLGAALVGTGGFALFAAVSTFGSGDGYAKMAGLLMGLGGAGLVAFGLALLSQARNAAVSGLSKGLLGAALVVVIVASLIQ